jgi:hypothetical protein
MDSKRTQQRILLTKRVYCESWTAAAEYVDGH